MTDRMPEMLGPRAQARPYTSGGIERGVLVRHQHACDACLSAGLATAGWCEVYLGWDPTPEREPVPVVLLLERRPLSIAGTFECHCGARFHVTQGTLVEE